MNAYRRLIQRLGHKPWFAAIMKRVLPPLDRAVHRLSGGRVRVTDSVLPLLVLTSIGRRSGQPREQPLAYLEVEDGWAVAATSFGQERHPAWSYNLLANPRATVTIGRRHLSVEARLTEPDEKAALWPRFVAMWPAFDTYVERSHRDIRVFVLQPVGPAGG